MYLYEALRPILLTTALLGLSPIYPKMPKKLQIYNICKILSIIYMATFTFLLYFSTKQSLEFHQNYSSGVSKIGIIFQGIGQISIFYIIYLVHLWQSNSFFTTIEEIAKSDELISYNYRKHYNYEITVILTGFIGILGQILLNFWYSMENVAHIKSLIFIVYNFPSVVCFFSQCYFAFLVHVLYGKFVWINQKLRCMPVQKSLNSIFNYVINITPRSF